MTDNPTSVNKILKLLEEITSLEVVRHFLKSKGLRHSAGSWAKLAEKRIYPAIEDGSLSVADLKALLSEAEEHGRQHVFLYKTSAAKAKQLIDQDTVTKKLKAMGLKKLINQPLVSELPEFPEIVDVRWENDGRQMIVKVVETRVSVRPLREDDSGDIITKTYERVRERAVSVVKVHASGLAELRIGSRTTGSRSYETEVTRLRHIVAEIISLEDFHPVFLDNAKERIWNEREGLADRIRYSNATLRDDFGYSIRASVGSQLDDLSENEGVSDSINAFIEHDAYCDSNNIYFKENEDSGCPSKDIHVLMTGELNEYALTVHCQKSDYEYVLKQLQLLNKQVP